jgi:hypothetical protein
MARFGTQAKSINSVGCRNHGMRGTNRIFDRLTVSREDVIAVYLHLLTCLVVRNGEVQHGVGDDERRATSTG